MDVEEAHRILQTHLETFGISALGAIEVLENTQNPPADDIDADETDDSSPETPLVTEAPIAETERGSALPFVAAGGLVVTIAVFLYLLYFRAKQPARPAAAQSTETGLTFAGKLDLYIRTIPDEIDTPPATFQLSRAGKNREMSLGAILQKCGISNVFPEAEHIYFISDEQGMLQVVNNTNRTILIGTNTLAETQSHTLRYGERVCMRSEDETSELVISPRFLYRAR